MTITLPEELETAVRAEVQSGRYASEDAAVAEMVREHLRRQDGTRTPTTKPDPGAPRPKRLWEVAAELSKTIPEEEWDKLPVDASRQLDHYIHGSPKRPE